jgi:predicted phosphohydrolase
VIQQAVAGRLPSQVLGLHLERNGRALRLYDPATERWLPTPLEKEEVAEERNRLLEAEIERLRREVAALRRRQPKTPLPSPR